MGQRMKSFPDGSYLEYSRGRFDQWCVYLIRSNGVRRSPRDKDYFTQLKSFADRYGVDRIYGDFVRVYDITGQDAEQAPLDAISRIAAAYGRDALAMDVLFSTLYLAMIAEEKKAGTHLGKRIKRLGVHKLLVENCSVDEAANFMRDMPWQTIAKLCEERGF